MDSSQFRKLIETIRSESGTAEEAEKLFKLSATREDIPRLVELLLDPDDNLLQEIIAVPYARLEKTKGLETLLRAYQLYPGHCLGTIQELLLDIVETDPVEAQRILKGLALHSDVEMKKNAIWLMDWLKAEALETPLDDTLISNTFSVDLKVANSERHELRIVAKDLAGNACNIQFHGVHAYRQINACSLSRPLARPKAWIVRILGSAWSKYLDDEAHMHPHPYVDHSAHYQMLCAAGGPAIDVFSQSSPMFTLVELCGSSV